MKKYYGLTTPEITTLEVEHMELSRKLAAECVVLLENNGTLPLEKKGNIALFGDGARKTVKGGTGSGDVHSRINVTIEEGLEQAGYIVSTKDWLNRYDQSFEKARERHRAMIKKKAEEMGTSEVMLSHSYPMEAVPPILIAEEDVVNSKTDTAVYVISRNSGEGKDRRYIKGDYLPFDEELENLRLLADKYNKTIVILNIGGVMDLSDIKEIRGIDAVLLMGQLGNIGGNVLADILTGDVTPSGKLTDTWARRYEDYPSSATFSDNDGDVNDEYYTEGIYVGYRYFETFDVNPVYWFGYGMSYTDFDIKCESVYAEDGKVIVDVKVKNKGNKFSGKEVVQVYYSAPSGQLEKPVHELAAFVKTKELKPDEEQMLQLEFQITDMASYSEENASWILEKGRYIIGVGNSLYHTEKVAAIFVRETILTEKVQNCFQEQDKTEEIHPDKKTDILGEGCVEIEVSPQMLSTQTNTYEQKREKFHTFQDLFPYNVLSPCMPFGRERMYEVRQLLQMGAWSAGHQTGGQNH